MLTTGFLGLICPVLSRTFRNVLTVIVTPKGYFVTSCVFGNRLDASDDCEVDDGDFQYSSGQLLLYLLLPKKIPVSEQTPGSQ